MIRYSLLLGIALGLLITDLASAAPRTLRGDRKDLTRNRLVLREPRNWYTNQYYNRGYDYAGYPYDYFNNEPYYYLYSDPKLFYTQYANDNGKIYYFPSRIP